MYDQLHGYNKHFLDKLLCGFCKAHSTQHALFRLLPQWLSDLDSGWFVTTILKDLSEAYYCLPYNPLIEKLVAFESYYDSSNIYIRMPNIKIGIKQLHG